MKEITVISGKGGTGKTSITAGLISFMKNSVFSDCDVDAANLSLILNSEKTHTFEFKGGKKAEIIQERCVKCGDCMNVCEFGAIEQNKNGYNIFPFSCEGCGACFHFCPHNAIDFSETKNGEYYHSDTPYGKFFHASLLPGEENSGKLVVTVKNEAKKFAIENNKDFILSDGSPGTGCPVIASISGSDYIIIVTEPTFSGIHDLKRVIQLINKFNIKCGVVINKSDINLDRVKELESFLLENNISLLEKIPFDKEFVTSMINGKPITEYLPNSESSKKIFNIYKKLMKITEDLDEQ